MQQLTKAALFSLWGYQESAEGTFESFPPQFLSASEIFNTQFTLNDPFSLTSNWHQSQPAYWSQFIKKPKAHQMNLMLETEYMLDRYGRDVQFLSMFQSDIACDLCSRVLEPVHFLLKNRFVVGVLEEIAYDVCMHFKIHGGISSVCRGAIDIMTEPLLPAIDEGILSSFRICDEYLHLCNNPVIKELSADEYVRKRLESKPESIKNNDFVNKIYEQIASSTSQREIVRSIQLSDPHIDFKYQVGAPSKCNYPICCRDNGPDQVALEGSEGAGKWGDYNCDIPVETLRHMFKFMATMQKDIDFMTWVGDNSAHNVWDNTNQEITEYTNQITQMLKEAMGPDSKIQFYPSLGNHDTWPVNVQDFSEPNANYPINHIKGNWTGPNWLSAEEAETFAKFGYYSKPLPFNPKGKVISLNTQACNNKNWWLLDNRQDPGNQIEWLEKELAQLEKQGGFVYMIAHIPVHECLHQFGVRYHALMERYQHIVRFSSFGHSHKENFFVTRAINTTEMIGVNLITGSGTSGGDKNPAFTVIDWDKEFMVPIDIHTYFMNLTEANLSPDVDPTWRLLHSFKSSYNLSDLSPASMKDFAERMYNDGDLASEFEWNSYRRGGKGSVRPVVKPHQRTYLCKLTSETFEEKDCYGHPHISPSYTDVTGWFEYLIANWIKVTSK